METQKLSRRCEQLSHGRDRAPLLLLLPSLTTGLLIHVLGVCGSDESSNPFYYVHNCLHIGIEEKTCRNKCFNFNIPRTTRAERQFILAPTFHILPPFQIPDDILYTYDWAALAFHIIILRMCTHCTVFDNLCCKTKSNWLRRTWLTNCGTSTMRSLNCTCAEGQGNV